MLPLKDLNPTERTPYVTYALLAVNAAVFVYQSILPPVDAGIFIFQFGAIPARLFGLEPTHYRFLLPAAASLITTSFLHGSWLHLGSNVLFLWIFGDNVEDRMGRWRFLLFYLAGGMAATLAHAAVEPGSTVPLVGASGAISAVLAAYLIMFPRAQVLTLIPIIFIFHLVKLPAFVILGYWFLLQVIEGVYSLGGRETGIAFFAHIGGFVFGLAVALSFYRKKKTWRPKRSEPPWDSPPDDWY